MKPALVHSQVARVLLNKTPNQLMEDSESGTLLYVFTVSAPDSGQRLLRFWITELTHPTLSRIPIQDAVNQIIGVSRERLRLREVTELISVSAQHLLKLAKFGELILSVEKHTGWISRASLEKFLIKRWLGSQGNSGRSGTALSFPEPLLPSRRLREISNLATH